MYRVLPLTVNKQKDYNLKREFISTLCIETLVQSRTFVYFPPMHGPGTMLRALCIGTVMPDENKNIQFIHGGNFSIQSPFQCVCLIILMVVSVWNDTFPPHSSSSFASNYCDERCARVLDCFYCHNPTSAFFSTYTMRKYHMNDSMRIKQIKKRASVVVFCFRLHITTLQHWTFMVTNRDETNDFLFLLSDFFIVSICCSDTREQITPTETKIENWCG